MVRLLMSFRQRGGTPLAMAGFFAVALWLVLVSGGAVASANQAPGGVQDFEFASYSADYYLSRDAQQYATLHTVETFVAQFPAFDQTGESSASSRTTTTGCPWRQLRRGALGDNYDGVPLETSVQSVVDERGTSVPFESTDSGDFTQLALGTDKYVHGKTRYVISYTQRNVVRAFPDTSDDEFYWDTTGAGFDQPFGTVTARVHIDPSITQYLTGNNACYFGAQGSTTQCTISPTTATQPSQTHSATGSPAQQDFTASATNLAPNENLSVVIGFELGTFVPVPAEVAP